MLLWCVNTAWRDLGRWFWPSQMWKEWIDMVEWISLSTNPCLHFFFLFVLNWHIIIIHMPYSYTHIIWSFLFPSTSCYLPLSSFLLYVLGLGQLRALASVYPSAKKNVCIEKPLKFLLILSFSCEFVISITLIWMFEVPQTLSWFGFCHIQRPTRDMKMSRMMSPWGENRLRIKGLEILERKIEIIL